MPWLHKYRIIHENEGDNENNNQKQRISLLVNDDGSSMNTSSMHNTGQSRSFYDDMEQIGEISRLREILRANDLLDKDY